ncbi:MAG: sortase B protein-sorting domain-containing protein [Clostridia bacterium]|nr:sortase B protein-sorting domain-containing protein [Clostridia bacterium]
MTQTIRVRKKRFLAFLMALVFAVFSMVPSKALAQNIIPSGDGDYSTVEEWINRGYPSIINPDDTITFGTDHVNVKYYDYDGTTILYVAAESRGSYVVKHYDDVTAADSASTFSHWEIKAVQVNSGCYIRSISFKAVAASTINSVSVSVEAPKGGQPFPTVATCSTTGVKEVVSVDWTTEADAPVGGNADYSTVYNVYVTLDVDAGYAFSNNVAVECNTEGVVSKTASLNDDGLLVVKITINSNKAKLLGITPIQPVIGVTNGAAKTVEGLGLPTTVPIQTESAGITNAAVVWDLDNLVSGSYDPLVSIEQTFTVKGTVNCGPNVVNTDNLSLEITVSITVDAAPAGEPSDTSDADSDDDERLLRYKFTDGADGTYTINKDKDYGVRIDADFSKYASVEMDGNTVDSSNYNAMSGSTIIIFTEEYMSSLSTGIHAIKVNFTDGLAETVVTVKMGEKSTEKTTEQDKTQAQDKTQSPTEDKDQTEANEQAEENDNTKDDGPKSPQTGDRAPIVWLFTLLIASGAGLTVIGTKRKKSVKN